MKTTIDLLVSELLAAKESYYNKTPIMSDADFDSKEEQLRNLDPKNDYFGIVGASVSGIVVPHKVPMLSQQKALTDEEASKWVKSMLTSSNEATFVASTKLDGISCALHYYSGQLELAVTRGDGECGTDITHKVQHLVPMQLPSDFEGEIRGELALSFSNFEKLNSVLRTRGEKEMDNPRNAAAGIINEEKLDLEKVKFLQFIGFGLIDNSEGMTYIDDLDFIRGSGLQAVHHMSFSSEVELLPILREFETLRKSFDFPLDGVVIRINDNDRYYSLGNTSHHPRGAIAWKFEAEEVIVTVKNISWSVATVDISPVAEFEPTRIGTANISKCSLKSVKNMVDLGITVGSRIVVVRSGDVIPHVRRVAE